MTGRGRRDSEGPNPRQVLHQRTVRAVRGWIGHSGVRAAVESEWWRSGVTAALQPLEEAVGLLDQRGVSWLLVHSLGADMWPPEEAEWRDTYEAPSWAGHPATAVSGDALAKVTTALADALAKAGIGLDPGSLADRLVLAQLLALDCRWEDLDSLVDDLNIGAIGGVHADGRGTVVDRHGGDREARALETLRRQRLPPIRVSYPARQGMYDEALKRILNDRPDVTADGLTRALAAGEDWVASLRPYYEGRDPDDFRRTLQRALNRLREG